jgi:acyl carrier protein
VDISEDVKKSVIEKVAMIKKITPESIQFSHNLILELHCDSLDMAEIK